MLKIDAVLWDYDGTLVDSAPKNISTTKEILSDVIPRLSGKNLPECLQSPETYHIANHKSKNWPDLYMNYYGMTEQEMLMAGSMWNEYQLKNTTPVILFSGIAETIRRIALPQGICSQNSAENIRKLLYEHNLSDNISSIVGYNDVPVEEQKPCATAGIKCLKELFDKLDNKTFLYIGDHEGDILFARNIAQKLPVDSRIFAATVTYSGADISQWNFKPDFEISKPADLLLLLS